LTRARRRFKTSLDVVPAHRRSGEALTRGLIKGAPKCEMNYPRFTAARIDLDRQ